MADQPQLLLCTCPSAEVAQVLATALVEQSLAACINVIPHIQSIYRWQGQVEQSSEVLLLIKAMRCNYSKIAAYISQYHPYDNPELIAFDIKEGLPSYLQWLQENSQ